MKNQNRYTIIELIIAIVAIFFGAFLCWGTIFFVDGLLNHKFW